MTRAHPRLAAALASVLAGCALLSKSEPLQVRYFSPEPARSVTAPDDAPSPRSATSAPPLALMLGRVRASSHLRERIAYRKSSHELGFYDTRRWTERPESYLRRALSAALFEQRGLEPVLAGPAPTLDVELVAFEHVLEPAQAARLQLVYVLYGSGLPNAERMVELQQPIGGTREPMDGVAQAFAAVLGRAVTHVAADVVAQLQQGARAVPPPGAPELDTAQPMQDRTGWTTPPANAD